MSDFGAGTCDFHSDYGSDFRDFPGDFGGAPRTAKQPPETPETAPSEQAAPPTRPQVNENGGKLAAQAASHGAEGHATMP